MDNFSNEVMEVVIDGLVKSLPSKDVLFDTIVELEKRYSKLQSRKSLVRNLISSATNELTYSKTLNRKFYQDATPETLQGQFAFALYKETRTDIKTIKREIKVLVETQMDTKEQMKQTSALLGMLHRQLGQ